ncbi:STAS domain-containing protein [Streptomyces sp. NPDC090025]|uniref:STAS domain-containing protein n=1 Tax=Streptomyces sp. NPDC090025 TaxID=3365922 RepID=UPI0038383F8C
MHLIRRGDPQLAVRSSEGLTTAELYGELDLVLVQRVRHELDVLAREATALTVDLRHITFCDASGLGLLVRCAQRVQSRAAPWRLVCDHPMTLRLIRLAALDEVLRPTPPGPHDPLGPPAPPNGSATPAVPASPPVPAGPPPQRAGLPGRLSV